MSDTRRERMDAMVDEIVEQVGVLEQRNVRLQVENDVLRKVARTAETFMKDEQTLRLRHLPLLDALDDYNRLEQETQ
jgi:regulator of replication initiation timing